MTVTSLIIFLIIGLAAGWIAGQVMRGRGLGLAGNLIIGVIGAYLGGFLFNLLGLTAHNIIGELIAATIGAIVLLWIIGLLKRV